MGCDVVVFMFQERFVSKVLDGSKTQTIRAKSKRVVRVGDTLSLRKWCGKPYRSKQVILRAALCTGVDRLTIDRCGDIRLGNIGGDVLLARYAEAMAKKDGFENLDAMLDWFRTAHGLPFEGVLIQWEPK